MGSCRKCLSILNVYWNYTRNWFLGIAVGMAVLELGLLLYYVNGGYRYMYITEGGNKFWPMEYAGALKSIRLEYIVAAFGIAFLVFLILSYFSVSAKNSTVLLQRLPISSRMQTLMQITHSLIMLVSIWLVQFLIVLAGFFLYRYGAPAGLRIDLQIFKAFWGPGFLFNLYPVVNSGFVVTWLLCLISLSVLPSYIVHKVRLKEHRISAEAFLISVALIIVAIVIRTKANAEMKKIIDIICLLLFSLAMFRSLFFREIHLHIGAKKK